MLFRSASTDQYLLQLLVQLLQQVLVSAGESPYAIQFVDDTSHETAGQLDRKSVV